MHKSVRLNDRYIMAHYRHYELSQSQKDDVLIKETSFYDNDGKSDDNTLFPPSPHPDDATTRTYPMSAGKNNPNGDEGDRMPPVMVSRPLRRRRLRETNVLQQNNYDDDDDDDGEDDEHDETTPAAMTNAFAALEALLLMEQQPQPQKQPQLQSQPHQRDPLEPFTSDEAASSITSRSLKDYAEPIVPSSPSTLSPSPRKAEKFRYASALPPASQPQQQQQQFLLDAHKGSEKAIASGIHPRRRVREEEPEFSKANHRTAPFGESRKDADQPKTKRKESLTMIAMVAPTTKSIVGSRPKHWGAAPLSLSSKRQDRPTAFLQASRQKRKAELTAALTRATSSSRVKMMTTLRPPASLAANASNQRLAPAGEQMPLNTDTTSLSTCSAPLSFAPAFFSTAARSSVPASCEAVMENDDLLLLPEATLLMSPSNSNNRMAGAFQQQRQPLQPNGTLSPAPGRKSKAVKGPLAKRLKSIRDGIKGDAIRFSSGQYPFSVRSVDRNDPRNRADSVCDVTILGNPIPWDTHQSRGESSSNRHQQNHQHRLMTALSYVHSWITTGTSSRSARSEQPNFDGVQRGMRDGELAWIVFAYDTAREQNLALGSQLRIYNAVSAPCAIVTPTTTSSTIITTADSNSDVAKTQADGVKWIVLCSQLCEAYPSSVLPPLPDVSAVINTIRYAANDKHDELLFCTVLFYRYMVNTEMAGKSSDSGSSSADGSLSASSSSSSSSKSSERERLSTESRSSPLTIPAAELIRQRAAAAAATTRQIRRSRADSHPVAAGKNVADSSEIVKNVASTDTVDLDEEIRRLEEELERDDDDDDESDSSSTASSEVVKEQKAFVISLSKSKDEKIESLPASLLPAARKRTLKGVDSVSATGDNKKTKRKRTDRDSGDASGEQNVSEGLKFAVQEILRGYQPRSSERLPFYCRVCAKQFENEDTFNSHKEETFHKTAVQMERKASFCKLCRKQLTSPAQLKEHLHSKPHKQRLQTVQSAQQQQNRNKPQEQQRRQWT